MGNTYIDAFWNHFWTHFWSVTERDKRRRLRGAREVGLDGSSEVGTIENRLSSTSCVDFHYSFVQVRHLDPLKLFLQSVTRS